MASDKTAARSAVSAAAFSSSVEFSVSASVSSSAIWRASVAVVATVSAVFACCRRLRPRFSVSRIFGLCFRCLHLDGRGRQPSSACSHTRSGWSASSCASTSSRLRRITVTTGPVSQKTSNSKPTCKTSQEMTTTTGTCRPPSRSKSTASENSAGSTRQNSAGATPGRQEAGKVLSSGRQRRRRYHFYCLLADPRSGLPPRLPCVPISGQEWLGQLRKSQQKLPIPGSG